ncbi:single-strand DNA-binding protein [Thermoanaerobacter thermohydrosulfuricus]|uniref:Single-stranded DNA-binding protein n=1 Tax=Thermoanaerobacter thermohydrosulfuricus TaxID=1516 RepID=A0A1G7MQY2_THETY|nr:single-stranded DNA-binding protein [Thermoanaerobacter thermohydrosulfuricus]SDF64117.1 single-strand DNA-binding protein [Thermoanaerobacter thermohydrosulfuricus]
MSLNKVFLIGRTTKDVKKTQLPSGSSVVHFTLAVDRNYTDKDGKRPTDFIDVTAWDKLAEILEQYVPKGMLVAVEGRLQTRKYQNSSGKTVYVTEVIAEDIHLLLRPRTEGLKEISDTENRVETAGKETETSEFDEFSFDEDFESIFDEDIFLRKGLTF